MPDDVLGLVAIVLICGGIPLTAIWTSHKRKMMELQLRLRHQGSAETQASVEALRQEVRALRETTMQYDLSFDSALQRVEGRVEGLERRVNEVETSTNNLRVGR